MATTVTGGVPSGVNNSMDGNLNQSKENAGGNQELSKENAFWVQGAFDANEVTESKPYNLQLKLLEDPRLESNVMYKNLCQRLSDFYLNSEKIRLCGLTETQEQEIRKSGYSFKQRVELHKSLRAMLIQIVSERDQAMKERQLDETYRWYIDKQIAMGLLTEEMKQQEF